MGIDEMIFQSFLPPRLSKNLEDMKIALPEAAETSPDQKESQEIIEAYTRSALFLFMAVAFVVVFVIFQPVLPYFAWDATDVCSSYLQEEGRPWCMPWNQTECFPLGRS